MSRRTKLNKEMIDKICGYISQGLFYVQAANLSGVCEATFYEWKRKGEEAQSKGEENNYTEFLKALKEADAKQELECIKKIKIDDSWQSKAWLLERRHGDRWGKREQLNINHGVQKEDAKILRGILGNMTDEDFEHALNQAGVE